MSHGYTPSTSNLWHSPIPYLFGGLAAMLALISLALVVLACSYKKSSNSPTPDQDDPEKLVLQAIDIEPRVLVIMAGNDKPTYLATPMVATSPSPLVNIPPCTCDQV